MSYLNKRTGKHNLGDHAWLSDLAQDYFVALHKNSAELVLQPNPGKRRSDTTTAARVKANK
jgi:hypothetical protein